MKNLFFLLLVSGLSIPASAKTLLGCWSNGKKQVFIDEKGYFYDSNDMDLFSEENTVNGVRKYDLFDFLGNPQGVYGIYIEISELAHEIYSYINIDPQTKSVRVYTYESDEGDIKESHSFTCDTKFVIDEEAITTHEVK